MIVRPGAWVSPVPSRRGGRRRREMLAGALDHNPDILPALMVEPWSASIRCSSAGLPDAAVGGGQPQVPLHGVSCLSGVGWCPPACSTAAATRSRFAWSKPVLVSRRSTGIPLGRARGQSQDPLFATGRRWLPGLGRAVRYDPVDGHEVSACRCPRIDADEAVDVVAAAQPARAGEHQLDSGLAGRQAVCVGTQRRWQVGVHAKSPFRRAAGVAAR